MVSCRWTGRLRGDIVWRLLADLVVLVHVAFVAFVVVGGFAVRRWPALAWLHLPAVVWGAAVELAGWVCPLTPLENVLRARAGAAPYEGDFVGRYLVPLLYPEDLSPPLQRALGALVLALNTLVYASLVRTRRRGSDEVHAHRPPTP
jgi:hypothetical protein